MRNSHIAVVAVALLTALAGCTSGQSGVEPASRAADLTKDKLQDAVGVATFTTSAGPVRGLNVVATFRQPNGLSATLLNTPFLSGPFVVPAVAPPGDAGSSHISGSPQILPGQTAASSTFGTSGGIFAYGFAPANSTTSGGVSFNKYSEPFYTKGTMVGAATMYVGGPPAYPQVRNGNFDPFFTGYPEGFTSFVMPTGVGAYTLSVGIQDANGNTTMIAAPTATLNNATGLGPSAKPTVASKDGNGGLTVAFTAPAGTTESLVNIVDTGVGAGGPLVYYTVLVSGSGAQTATLPANLGPFSGGVATASIPTGDDYSIRIVNVDYPAFEAGPPNNIQQLPALLGGAGQADISFAPTLKGTY